MSLKATTGRLYGRSNIARWLWPDSFRNQDASVSKAKQAISHYKKGAVGDPAGLTELKVFYCEQAAGYCQDIGYPEKGFFDVLVRMFEQALESLNTLPADRRDGLVVRLNRVREIRPCIRLPRRRYSGRVHLGQSNDACHYVKVLPE